MGLYLCVFDDCGEEIAGVEVWRYQYFGDFRDLAAGFVRKRKVASSMTTLLNHPDCNGIWSVKDCKKLLSELEELGAASSADHRLAAGCVPIVRHYAPKPL